MLDFNVLPTVSEQDVEVGREYEVCTSRSSPQTAIMPATVSENGGEYDVQTKHSSAQEAIMPAKGQEVVGEYEEKSSSGQKASRPANELEDITMTNPIPIGERTQGQSSGDTDELQSVSPMLLGSADERQGKGIKQGKASIKDYEATTNRLEKTQTNVQVRLQSFQSQPKDTKKQLAVSKTRAGLKNTNAQPQSQPKDTKKKVAVSKTRAGSKITKAQPQSQKKELAACRRNLKASKKNGRDLTAKIKDLQKCLADSREEFCRCKDDLFSLQTVTQISDSIISGLFESLSQHIVQWIDMEVAAFEKANAEDDLDRIWSIGGDKVAATFLRLHPHAGEHLARYLIHRFLQNNIFGKKIYFFGLPDETAQLLRKAELNMAELDPPKGM